MRNSDSAARAAVLEPLFVAAVSGKEVSMSLDRYACFGEDSRKLLSEVAISEINAVHAARE